MNLKKYGWYPKGLIASPLKGPAGNQEYLLWMGDERKGNIDIEKINKCFMCLKSCFVAISCSDSNNRINRANKNLSITDSPVLAASAIAFKTISAFSSGTTTSILSFLKKLNCEF